MRANNLTIKLYNLLKSPIFIEILIVVSLIFTINNYFERAQNTIKSDGIGYYDYLPSIFMHGDLNRKNHTGESNPELYKRINQLDCYLEYGDYRVNKYPVGTALLQSPFFYYTYLQHGKKDGFKNGYQKYYHKTIYHAALFYVFLSILFLRLLLTQYRIKRYVIIICQLLIVLATSITNYVHFDASFSHVYSLFAITAFLYLSKVYFVKKQFKFFLWACLFLGLIVILRQINILILFFIPFLAGSFDRLKDVVLFTLKNKKKLLIGLALFFSVVFIQFISWYLQTGSFIVYSYQGEEFNWSNPQIFNILFSYRKGLFLYTPVLFICLFGLVWFISKKRYYLLLTWLGFFLLLTYVLSSWWHWQFGASYGLRAYIDYYAIFFIPFAFMLNNLKLSMKIIIVALASITIPINFIQTYQYKNYILHWEGMDKEKYWKVFLKTDAKYEGIIWDKELNESKHVLETEINVGNIEVNKGDTSSIKVSALEDLPNFTQINAIQVLIDHHFNESINSAVGVEVTDYYNYKVALIHFAKDDFSKFQSGFYSFKFEPIEKISNNTVILKIYAQDSLELKNVRMKFFSRK